MKKSIIKAIALCIVAAACSNSNETMTKLINEKRGIEDSIKIAHGMELILMDSARAMARSGGDSTIYLALGDSSAKYYGVGRRLKNRLSEVEASIDSLSKMK